MKNLFIGIGITLMSILTAIAFTYCGVFTIGYISSIVGKIFIGFCMLATIISTIYATIKNIKALSWYIRKFYNLYNGDQ